MHPTPPSVPRTTNHVRRSKESPPLPLVVFSLGQAIICRRFHSVRDSLEAAALGIGFADLVAE